MLPTLPGQFRGSACTTSETNSSNISAYSAASAFQTRTERPHSKSRGRRERGDGKDRTGADFAVVSVFLRRTRRGCTDLSCSESLRLRLQLVVIEGSKRFVLVRAQAYEQCEPVADYRGVG